MSFILATDSDSDLPLQYVEENRIHIFPVPVCINGIEFEDDLGKSYNHKDFYNKVREGSLPTTSQVNVYTFFQHFETWVKEDKEVLYISFTSALSGIYNSAMMAREQILEEYPHAKITIIDSLCVSAGEGLLVYYANELKKEGQTLKEIIHKIEEMKPKIVQVALVQDLQHLVRGGRVSSVSGLIGSLLQVKPILYVTGDGKIEPFQKARGKKKALKMLIDTFNVSKSDETDIAFVVHADCEEEANKVAQVLEQEHGIKVILTPLGPGIGAHTGADTLALCFLGKNKVPQLA